MKPIFNSNKSSNQIKSYSAFATALLMSNQLVNAGVVYTDIDPDLVWKAGCYGNNYCLDSTSFILDINNDQINDIEINGRFSYSSYTSVSSFGLKALNAKTEIASKNNMVSKLNEFDLIGSSLSWNKSYGQPFNLFWQMVYLGYAPLFNQGDWKTANEKYIGIKFENNGDYYFGWIRLSISNKISAKKITILDYAYNDVPNTPIIAGDTTQLTTKIQNTKLNNFDISMYSFNNKIFVDFQHAPIEGYISVVNLFGQEIYKNKLIADTHSQITIDDVSGNFYVVSIQTEKGLYTKKVFLKNN